MFLYLSDLHNIVILISIIKAENRKVCMQAVDKANREGLWTREHLGLQTRNLMKKLISFQFFQYFVSCIFMCHEEECNDTNLWVEHRSPANKHNCWNGWSYWGHMTRSGGYINDINGSDKVLTRETYAKSLGIAGQGHISVDCVAQYIDQFGCVLVLVAVGQGHLTWIPGSQHSCHLC